MTQAIDTNNYNKLNEALMTDVSAVTPVSANDFTKVLDAKIEKIDCKLTIGDMKKQAISGDSSADMANFRELLTDVTNEANVESSLDLTLARDINDIISQLRSSLKLNIENTDSTDSNVVIDETADTTTEDNVSADTEENTNNTEDTNNISFEQILSMAGQFILPEASPVVEEVAAEVSNIVGDVINNVKTVFNKETSEQNILTQAAQKVTEEITNIVEDSADDADIDLGLDEGIINDLNIESVEAETDMNQGGAFAQQQSAEEYGIKAMIQNSVDGVKVNFENLKMEALKANAIEITADKIIEQITKHLDKMSGSKVNIVLNPESLGKVSLQLINTKEGLSAQFTVTTQEARDLIMRGLDGLKQTLLTHGVNVDSLSVKVTETEKESYNSDWTDQEGSRGGNKDDGHPNREEKEKGLFEKTIAKTLKKNGNV